MTITLTIDNLDALPDGGPVRFQARNRGFEIGREQHLDWTLPDPERYISGRHCEVRFEDGAYFLYDVSSNGTYLNGASQRMKSPYRLADGDRLAIGHYVIAVAVERPDAPPQVQDEPFGYSGPAGAPSDDIWAVGGSVPSPVDRRDFMPPPDRRRAADFSEQFLDLPVAPIPSVGQPRSTDPLARAPAYESPFGDAPPLTPAPLPPAPGLRSESPFGSTPDAAAGGEGAAPLRAAPMPDASPQVPPSRPPDPPQGGFFEVARPASEPATPPVVRPIPQGAPPLAPQAPAGSGPRAFLEAMAAGAGVSPDVFQGRDAAELGHEVGAFMKAAVENIAQLLRARAAAKTMAKSTSRTMISAADNNPLKFIPSSAEAIDVMFARRRPGYLDARRSVEEAFQDLKRHELATYTAMQKALAKLLEELAPDAIEAKSGSGFGMKKARSWDEFVRRWEEKSATDNGMLDAFLAYFAEAYDEADRKR